MEKQQLTVKSYFEKEGVQKKFQELLGKKSVGFITSVMQVVNSNNLLQKATPESVYSAAAMAATLDLPINNNLGFAWIVPYNEKFKDQQGKWQIKCVAQFQMGWKGFVQLANRSGQYKAINVLEVYENQFKAFDRLSEELQADFTVVGSGKVVGFVAYFKLINGFEKTCYWSMEEVERHGAKFSKTYGHANGVWKTDFNAMAKKTVLKNTLSKWGILSIEMQQATVVDQAVVNDADTLDIEYVDGGTQEEVAEPKKELTELDFEVAKGEVQKGNTTADLISDIYELTEDQHNELKSLENAGN